MMMHAGKVGVEQVQKQTDLPRMMVALVFLAALVGFVVLALRRTSQSTRYRWRTAFHAAWALYWLPEEKCNAFLRSYELFAKDNVNDASKGI